MATETIELTRPHRRLAPAGQGARRDRRGRASPTSSSTWRSAARTSTRARPASSSRASQAELDRLIDDLQVHGANRVDVRARPRWWRPTATACCRPASTPPPTWPPTCSWTGHWLAVENPEMDCGIVVADGRARTIPMHRVRVGDQIVVGQRRGARARARQAAGPVGLRVHEQRGVEREAQGAHRAAGGRPDARRPRARRPGARGVRAGRGAHRRRARRGPPRRRRAGSTCSSPATASPPTTSSRTCSAPRSGVSVAEGTPTEGGHSNHLRVINEVRRHGSIAAAVDAGYVTGGVMATCVRRAVPFVLGGSIRDDGPLPDVLHRHRRGGRRHASRGPGRRRGAHAGVDPARHRRRQLPAGRRRDVLRRHQPGRRHEAGRPGQPPGRWASSPTSARSSASSPTRCAGRADGGAGLGAALPDVPAAPLRGALRDQPVDARGGGRRARRSRRSSGTASSPPCAWRAPRS